MEIARQSVGSILRNEKKAEAIKKKMNGTTLENVAKATGGSVSTATDVALGNPTIMNIGAEPKVVGTAFDLEAGKTSGLVVGNSGVFMVKTKKVTNAPETKDFSNLVSQKQMQEANSAQQRAYQALKDKADITDNRGKY